MGDIDHEKARALGARLREQRDSTPLEPEPWPHTAPVEALRCARCESSLEATARFCSSCGTAVSEGDIGSGTAETITSGSKPSTSLAHTETEPANCPLCRATFGAGTRRCPSCGTRLEGKETGSPLLTASFVWTPRKVVGVVVLALVVLVGAISAYHYIAPYVSDTVKAERMIEKEYGAENVDCSYDGMTVNTKVWYCSGFWMGTDNVALFANEDSEGNMWVGFED